MRPEGGLTMKRLTYKRNDGYAINLPNALSEKDETLEWTISERENGIRLEGDIPNRLAAIEDILGDGYDIDRLRELVEADKDGRCVVLPVKVGDKVWFTKFMWNYAKQPISAMVCGIKTFSSSGTFTYTALTDANNVSRSFINQDIGKTVFLTREAAEEALKGENNGTET